MKPHKISMTLDPTHTLVACPCGFSFDGPVGLAQIMATLHLLEVIANKGVVQMDGPSLQAEREQE